MNRLSSIGPVKAVSLAVATGFGSGFLPVSGTWGTLVALVLHRFLFPEAFTADRWLSGILILGIVSCIAIATAETADRHYGTKDDSRITVDEIAGYFVAVYALPAGWGPALSAFVVFRIMDIVKLPPAYRLQELPGGVGIVIDDLIAGLYSCLIVHAMYRWLL